MTSASLANSKSTWRHAPHSDAEIEDGSGATGSAVIRMLGPSAVTAVRTADLSAQTSSPHEAFSTFAPEYEPPDAVRTTDRRASHRSFHWANLYRICAVIRRRYNVSSADHIELRARDSNPRPHRPEPCPRVPACVREAPPVLKLTLLRVLTCPVMSGRCRE